MQRQSPLPHIRHGVTLVEVLMSLMIMSIGVSLVIALFPISAIRTAQATKMTNAAILKYNVESVVERVPALIFDPNGDFDATADAGDLREHVSAPSERNYIVDPNGYLTHAAAGQAAIANVADNDTSNRAFCDYFGNTGPTTPLAVLPRFDGGIRSQYSTLSLTNAEEGLALQYVASTGSGLGDGWTTVFDGFADSLVAGRYGVVLDTEEDLGDIPTSSSVANVVGYPSTTVPDPELSRITVFSEDAETSQSYVLTKIDGLQCLWTEDVNLNAAADAGEDFNLNGIVETRTLPVLFGPPGRVLIQQRKTHDFNWLLTVRRSPDGFGADVDVVVTYNNGVTPSDERVFVTPTDEIDTNNDGIVDVSEDTNGNGVHDTYSFRANSFNITVPETMGIDEDGQPVAAKLRKGGYVLDVDNARWYRVADYGDGDAAGRIRITLETTPSESSPNSAGRVIFLPGVVDVFPLGTIAYPASLPPLSDF